MSKQKRKNDGKFKPGPDPRRQPGGKTSGSFTDGPDPRRDDGKFKPGHDDRRLPGGKPAVVREFVQKLRETPVETLVEELQEMRRSPHPATRAAAWREWMRWGFGAPPKPPSDIEVPDDDKALLALLEKQLKQRALEGDPEAQLLLLRALDPKKYGGDVDPNDKPAPPKLNFTRLGQARAAAKPEAEADD